jgi:hypothetical protein
MKLILKFLLLFVSTLYAHTGVEVFIGNPVQLQWAEYGSGYEYMVEVSQLRDGQKSLEYISDWIADNQIEVEILEESSYMWEVYIKEIGKSCDDEYQCFIVEVGYFDFYFPSKEIEEPIVKEEEIPEEVVVVEQPMEEMVIKKEEEKKEKEEEVLGTTVERIAEEYVPKEEVKAVEEKKEVINRENSCEYMYNIDREKFTLLGCNISKPSISSSTYYTYNDMNVVSNKGEYENSLKIYIKNMVCSKFDVLNPKTWFGCDEVETGTDEYDIRLNHEVYFFKDIVISPSNYIFGSTNFEITRILKSIPTDLIFKGYFSLKHRGVWLDQELALRMPTTYEQVEDVSSGIYAFPFSKIVYVNQWHGCTKYQCPHRGIDFAVAKENIYASGSGVIVAKGYDTYYGECNSGGNYILIKYDNGHHMSYMHLEKTYAKNGQRVKGGDLIALSGNTGANNCQPLGYHLHFELREQRPQSSHIDPVPYINVDWRLVRTNMSDVYPKRLSGDNPHPKF